MIVIEQNIYYSIVNEARVRAAFEKMAVVVDRQNANDKNYVPMAPNFDKSLSFQAALDLVLQGCALPAGYTEPVLHRKRREYKQIVAPKASL
jgi:malate synthase